MMFAVLSCPWGDGLLPLRWPDERHELQGDAAALDMDGNSCLKRSL